MTTLTKKEIATFVKKALESNNQAKGLRAVALYDKWEKSPKAGNNLDKLPDDILDIIKAKIPPTTKIVKKEVWKTFLKENPNFDNLFCDLTFFTDLKYVRKQFGLKGKIEIMGLTKHNPDYTNVVNKSIPYKMKVCCDKNMAGAYRWNSSTIYVSKNPTGNVYIIVK